MFAVLLTARLLAQAPMNLANMDLAAIDYTCKPCEDFYQFSMGKWHQQNPMPADQTMWSKRWAGADSNFQISRRLAEDLASGKTKGSSNMAKLGEFYAACMDTAALDRLGAEPLQPGLKRIAAIRSPATLQREIANLRTEGIAVGIHLNSAADSDDSRQTIAAISNGMLGLPDRDYYLKQDARSAAIRARYLQHIERLMGLAGQSPARAQSSAATVLRLETDLARAQLSRTERRDPYKVNTHVATRELERLAPHFDFASYYKRLGLAFSGPVIVRDPGGLKEFDRQLHQTPLADWRALLAWDLVRSRAPLLSQPFRKEMFEFTGKVLAGQKEEAPRWRQCVNWADSELGDALGEAYVKAVFPPAAKAKMQEMVSNILAAMRDSILGLEWMTDATKTRALAKLATFKARLGYPEKWISYANVRISRHTFAANVAATLNFAVSRNLARIGKPTDRDHWTMTVPTSNASYTPSLNTIQFPAGILTPPMFSLDVDDAANYGAIGVVIGHEISHGFDDSGSQYDADGRLNNWWTSEDRKRFVDRTACVVDQFNGYFIEPGVAHNGKLVLGEAIGDLAGAKIAYMAYMKSLEGSPRPPDIGGFTPEQRFFLAWGQARGDAMTIERQRLYVVTDPHPVSKYRVIGPLSNLPEFRGAFGCKAGDPMVRPPEKLCRIW